MCPITITPVVLGFILVFIHLQWLSDQQKIEVFNLVLSRILLTLTGVVIRSQAINSLRQFFVPSSVERAQDKCQSELIKSVGLIRKT